MTVAEKSAPDPKPQKKPSAPRSTVFRLLNLANLQDAIRSKYLNDRNFSSESVQIRDREGLLVTGSVTKEVAAWCSRLSTLAGTRVRLGNTTVFGALLIRDGEDTAWALTFGMGYHLLDGDHIDPGFGMRIATRAATPEAIRTVTRTQLDHRSRTDNSSIPSGEALRGFGVKSFGELVSKLGGKAQIPGLSAGLDSITIQAADSLSVPLGHSQSAMLHDLDTLGDFATQDPVPELQVLEQLTRVKGGLKKELDQKLSVALKRGAYDRLALGWPHERVTGQGEPSSHKLGGLGVRGIVDDLPELNTLLELLIKKNPEDPLNAARSAKITLFRDTYGAEPISSQIPVLKWLVYELEQNGTRYCLLDGNWYAMDHDYAMNLQKHVSEIFDRETPVSLPVWHKETHKDEEDYNIHAAKAIGGVALDRKLVTTAQNPGGFEPCDIITRHSDLIHIKRVDKSAGASHLIAQAVVSTEALRHDEEARTKLRERIEAEGGKAAWLPERPRAVVLGLAKPSELTADSLMSFTQVTLARLDTELASTGVKLYVVPIVRPETN